MSSQLQLATYEAALAERDIHLGRPIGGEMERILRVVAKGCAVVDAPPGRLAFPLAGDHLDVGQRFLKRRHFLRIGGKAGNGENGAS